MFLPQKRNDPIQVPVNLNIERNKFKPTFFFHEWHGVIYSSVPGPCFPIFTIPLFASTPSIRAKLGTGQASSKSTLSFGAFDNFHCASVSTKIHYIFIYSDILENIIIDLIYNVCRRTRMENGIKKSSISFLFTSKSRFPESASSIISRR